ncbi:MAG: metal-dependent transcriptional regulator [Acidobacteria bacterium]|nr:metal-dependent transcriptional regulator [Acidobacteriota bacterium]
MENGWIWLWFVLALGGLLALRLWARLRPLARWRRWRALRERALFEDALKHLLTCEHSSRDATVESLAGSLGLSQKRLPRLIARMEAAGLLRSHGAALHLSSEGKQWALRVVRAHRLWERYLADEAGLPIGELHHAAERAEHRLTPEELDALDAHLGHPLRDPHGDPIPTAAGAVAPLEALPLTDWPLDQPAQIVHVEDEPEVIFKEIVAERLHPGMSVRILERMPEYLTIYDGQAEHRLTPVVAANIHVAKAPEGPSQPEERIRLADLADGEEAEVVALDPDCRGFSRRRLLDLGLTPGARVRVELSPAFGEPRAIRVRGTLIALRREQAVHVCVRSGSRSGGKTQKPGVSRQ